MNYRIPLFDLHYGAEEEAAALAVLRSGWISMGDRTAELERRIAKRVDVPHAVAMTNCTAALHLAVACVAGPGDEVIVPSMTFVATVNAVRYAEATPVFADIRAADDPTIDPEDVAQKINSRTRAIIAMHYAGFPCAMDALEHLAREHGIALIEDAAHAPDSLLGGRPLGGIGDLGCLSFFSNKNIACGEGGMLLTRHEEYARRARLMRSHGMTALSLDKARGHATGYDVVELGYNYRIDDIRAGILLAQLDRLDDDTARRAELRKLYIERLRGMEGLTIPFAESRERSSNYIFAVALKTGGAARRDALRARLAKEGIQTSIHYPPAHRFSIYAREGAASALPITEIYADHTLTLPLFYRMTEAQVDEVCTALRRGMEE
jgi:dTDP-4-amino-4,6-dideoxygalactose transaminase